MPVFIVMLSGVRLNIVYAEHLVFIVTLRGVRLNVIYAERRVFYLMLSGVKLNVVVLSRESGLFALDEKFHKIGTRMGVLMPMQR